MFYLFLLYGKCLSMISLSGAHTWTRTPLSYKYVLQDLYARIMVSALPAMVIYCVLCDHHGVIWRQVHTHTSMQL